MRAYFVSSYGWKGGEPLETFVSTVPGRALDAAHEAALRELQSWHLECSHDDPTDRMPVHLDMTVTPEQETEEPPERIAGKVVMIEAKHAPTIESNRALLAQLIAAQKKNREAVSEAIEAQGRRLIDQEARLMARLNQAATGINVGA